VFVVHGTKKFLERVKRAVGDTGPSTTALGNWYATAVFWKPQAALFVNERTLMPIIVPLAPATSVTDRFPGHVSAVFAALGLDRSFIESEVAEMSDCRLAKTNSRSLLGSMNEFVYLGKAFSDDVRCYDSVELSLELATVPCGPLYGRHETPENELRAFAVAWVNDRSLSANPKALG
jgi:hypothetical protein